MKIGCFDVLPPEAAGIREEVFVKEQGFQEEFDETDGHAFHLVLFEGELPAGTCRFFPEGRKEGVYLIGRLAVRKEYRGKRFGEALLAAAEQEIAARGGTCACLHAQVRARGFYEKAGYEAYGSVEPEEGCPHIWMKKELG